MALITKLIIWLFERYAFDEWVEEQNREEMERIKRENNLKSDEEVYEFLEDARQEEFRKAFEEGVRVGVKRILERGCRE